MHHSSLPLSREVNCIASLNPNDYLPSVYQAYIALNDIDAAVESFKKALDLEPTDGMDRHIL